MFRIILLMFVASLTQCGPYGGNVLPSNDGPILNPAEQADFCYLLHHDKDFDGKEIETTAILVSGFESSFMYDPGCIDKDKSVWFYIDSEMANVQLSKYLGKESPEFRTTGLERVRGKFVGTFEVKVGRGFGHMNSSEYSFVIKRADELSTVPAETAFPW